MSESSDEKKLYLKAADVDRLVYSGKDPIPLISDILRTVPRGRVHLVPLDPRLDYISPSSRIFSREAR